MTETTSVRQPWAWAIIHAGKDVQNRSWSTRYRGPLLIHASQKKDASAIARVEALRGMTPPAELPTGGVIGVVELVDVVRDADSAWAEDGQCHWLRANPRELPFTPARGRLGLFELPISPTAVAPSEELGPTNAMPAHEISRHFDHPRLRPAKPSEVPKPGESTFTFIAPARRHQPPRPEYRFHHSIDSGLLREDPPFSLRFEHWAPKARVWHRVDVDPGRDSFSPITEELAQEIIGARNDLYVPADDETYALNTATRMASYES